MSGADQSEAEFDFDEPIETEKRVENVIAEKGGLPDNNPFSDVVEKLREDGKSWNEITDLLDPVVNVVSPAAIEERSDANRQWDVVTVANEHDATQVTDVESHTVYAETKEEAEKQVEEELSDDSDMSVDPSRTAYGGVVKY